LEWKEAELLNHRKVPFLQESKNRNAGIIYFHSRDNPFGGYERIAEDLKNRPEDEILCRAYGVPTKSKSTQFPNFSVEVNVVKHESIPTKGLTRYMILDPAGRKNWFMAWIGVDEAGTFWVYREWPDVNVGDWAKWHGGKWIGGEGSKGLGYGIKDYVELIGNLEEDEEIFERLIDPRLGAAKYQTQNGASSIIEDLADAGLTFVPAPGLDIEDGLQALQTKMAYNRRVPMDSVNRPHFYISDRCQNSLPHYRSIRRMVGRMRHTRILSTCCGMRRLMASATLTIKHLTSLEELQEDTNGTYQYPHHCFGRQAGQDRQRFVGY
jgi:hypothetical protein